MNALFFKGKFMGLETMLLIVLGRIRMGKAQAWPYSWGYGASGVVGKNVNDGKAI